MKLRTLKAFFCTLGILICTGVSLVYADPIISAELSKSRYEIGDLVTLRINVTGNTGLHGIFFDLGFDAGAFSFMGLSESTLPESVNTLKPNSAHVLYAVSDPVTSNSLGHHVMVSFTLNDSQGLTSLNGTLAEISFRVIGTGSKETQPRFTFKATGSGAKGLADKSLTQTRFIDSPAISIVAGSGAYVQINSPQGNEAVFKDLITLSATSSAGVGYTYLIQNKDAGIVSPAISAQTGNVTNYPVSVAFGLNRLSIELRDEHKRVIASDVKTVFRSDSEVFVKIISPIDHALVNTDMVRFLITSPLNSVTVNGQQAEMLSEKQDGKNLFAVRLWLKKGFNTIKAEAVGPQKIKFSHSISVFYQRDDLVFRFVDPAADSVIKTIQSDPQLDNGSLRVRGEIGSAFQSNGVPNTVTLRVVYKPTNPSLNSLILVRDRELPISETTLSGQKSEAAYLFTNDFEIPVAKLESGELEITAYKNKRGGVADSEIHRVVHLTNNRLAINLVQPNIFNVDTMDSKSKIKGFNNAQDPDWGAIQLLKDASIGLAPTKTEMLPQETLSGSLISDLIETKNGTKYALVNKNNVMRLYKRDALSLSWEKDPLLSRDDMYGYALCETDQGVLLGVSNLYSSDNSGLYLLEGNKLKNIIIGEPIPHVQFIQNKNGVIYLYGSDYSYLYSFNIFSMEETGGKFKASGVVKTNCDNDLFISQFVLSDDAKTVLLLNNTGKLFVYQNLYGTGFELISFDQSTLSQTAEFSSIVRGEYAQGSYKAYLLISKSPKASAQVLMEHKTTNRLIMVSHLPDIDKDKENLLGVTFKDSRFVLLYKKTVPSGFAYTIRTANVLFNKLSFDPIGTEQVFSSPVDLVPGKQNHLGLLVLKDDSYAFGFSSNFLNPSLYEMNHSYPQKGTIAFDYRNPDAEALNGFSFLVNPKWLDSTEIKISFGVFDYSNNTFQYGTPDNFVTAPQCITLKDLLNQKSTNALYTVKHHYDAESGKELVSVDFVSPVKNRYLSFAFEFNSVSSTARSISELSIYKKVAVKLPKNSNESMILPINGWVSDPTSTEIAINETTIALEKNGFFSLPYKLNTAEKSKTIALSCNNAAGERASLSFNVNIFESINGLKEVAFISNSQPNNLTNDKNEFYTSSSSILVSARFFGMHGLTMGYETYAYVYVDGKETLKKIASGVFKPNYDENPSAECAILGTGYTSGRIENETIPLNPGKQQVLVYVENPGGTRSEFKIGTKYPDVVYNLPDSEQRICILNTDILPLNIQETVLNVTVDKQFDIQVTESMAEPYVYQRNYVISGQIKSFNRFKDIKVKSTNAGVLFSNNKQEIIIPVDELNRFEVPLKISVSESIDEVRSDILFIPTAPFLEWMKTGVRINAVKDYGNTYIVPDFSLMDKGNWDKEELSSSEKLLRVKIARHIPSGTHLSLTVNYTEQFSGLLVEEGTGTNIYRMRDKNGYEMKLKGLKNGQNRISWELSQKTMISSSSSGRKGMNDYPLEIQFTAKYVPTIVTFKVDPKSYYSKTSSAGGVLTELPPIAVTKQDNTALTVYLNGTLVFTDSSKPSCSVKLVDNPALLEGRNVVTIAYTEKLGKSVVDTFVFLYDTEKPLITLLDCTYDKNKSLSTFSVLVREANLQKIELYQKKNNVISLVGSTANYQITDIGDQTFKIIWTELENNTPVLHPSSAEVLYVTATDYAGNLISSAEFTGVTLLNEPTALTINPIDIASVAYTPEKPHFEKEEENWGNGIFKNRLKIFSADMTYPNLFIPSGSDYIIERSGIVTMVGNIDSAPTGKKLTLKTGKGVVLDKGFSIPLGTTLSVSKPSSDISRSSCLQVTRKNAASQLGVSFWFRFEGEKIYKADSSYKKILTLANGTLSDSPNTGPYTDYEIYLAYTDNTSSSYGDERLALIEWSGVRSDPKDGKWDGKWVEKTETEVLLSSGNEPELLLDRKGPGATNKDGWNLITVAVDSSSREEFFSPVFKISVNEKEPILVDYYTIVKVRTQDKIPGGIPSTDFIPLVTASIFNANAVYSFGNQDGANGTFDLTDKNGHFSIARAFYVDKAITNQDVLGLTKEINAALDTPSAVDPADLRPAYYTFPKEGSNPSNSSVGTGYLQLRVTVPVTDYYSDLENVDYVRENGSLRASEQKINRLKLSDGGNLIFKDATSAVADKLTVTTSGDWLVFTPDSNITPGRYSFANNFGSHTIVNDRWYSVYGTVTPVDDNKSIDASLVIVINGVEKRYKMDSGEFHYVFANESSVTPSKIVMYIETKTALKLKKTMFFTEGNYRLPDEAFTGLNVSSASTRYMFQKTGTVEFWYKPMVSNEDGFVDNNVTLFDSEFVKIQGVIGSAKHAVYKVSLSGKHAQEGKDFVNYLPCDVPLRAGWQHIQFSWDETTKDHVAYLFINGNLATKLEGSNALPVSPCMLGTISSADNVSFGSDLRKLQFANGFLDNIRIDNNYSLSRFNPKKPIVVSYSDGFNSSETPNPLLSISRPLPFDTATIDNFALTLTNEQGTVVYQNLKESISKPNLVIADYAPGTYTLSISALVNGFRFNDVFRFVKNDRPRFILKSSTALMIKNEPTNLSFDFAYQTSYLLEKDLQKYSGLELVLTGENAVGQPFSKKFYVVQDFTTFTHNDKWLLYIPGAEDVSVDNPEPFTVVNNEFTINVPGITTSKNLEWSFRSFYFSNVFTVKKVPEGKVTSDNKGIIPFAGLIIGKKDVEISGKKYEYKLQVDLASSGTSVAKNLTDFTVCYTVKAKSHGKVNSSTDGIAFNEKGTLFLYYDDMLINLGEGEFDCSITLLYKGVVVKAYKETLMRKLVIAEKPKMSTNHLIIKELSLLQILKSTNDDKAELYLSYDYDHGLVQDVQLTYDITILKESSDGGYTENHYSTGNLEMTQGFAILSGIPIGTANTLLEVQVYESITINGKIDVGLKSKKQLLVANRTDPPQVVLTNSVPSRIAYNNVSFSWMGYYLNTFKPEITYSYNFDNTGWSSLSSTWRSVEYYNLLEGYHRFSVRAYNEGTVSPDVVCVFYVDVNRPVIHSEKIELTKLYDEAGFLYAVDLKGAAEAVVDTSLNALEINGKPVQFKKDGSFIASGLPVIFDGDNSFTITAYDMVGNYSEKVIHVDNNLTEIIYPLTGSSIRYTPVTLVGRLPAKINTLVDIYVRDPLIPQSTKNDFSNWHKARINEDFTFFVEDIAINPGSYEREAHTTLEMAVVSTSGKIYTRSLDVFANEVTRPIDLTLSVHAVEGEQSDTQVTITAVAKVSNISSWSIDFTGDGIYDDVVIMDNLGTSQSQSWSHTYSSLGIVKPRVRAITREGIYFSVNDSLIIHEKIREASNKIVANPLSLTSLEMEDNSQRIFVLAGQSGNYRVEVYEIGRNESYVSNKLFQIALTGMGIDSPVKIVAIDAKTLLVAENKEGTGIIHTLRADEFDAFIPVTTATLILSNTVSDIDYDKERLYITQCSSNIIATVDIIAGIPQSKTLVFNEARIINGNPLGNNMGISKDDYGILLSDFDHQRIVRLADNFTTLEYMGTQGYGEGQFIKPSLIKSFQNRIFVYDKVRADVQFFDPEFKPITRLVYSPEKGMDNYLDANFMEDMVGVSVFTREESNRLFYYAVLLSKSSNKMAVLRMPQWEEMRAKVRNNKIIFLKDNEVYSAKPTGSDLGRLISSDSIPRINGSVDYPTLSPDGKRIAFTSRAKLYDGSGKSTAGTTYAYDNLYMMNTNGSSLTRIPLSAMQGFEIERPQFNSNGTKLVFSAKPTGGHWQIYIYTFETGSVMRLFSSDENARFPYYSPDDRFIAFTTDYDGDEDIQIYDTLNPSMRVTVTNNRARDSFPVWSVVYPGEIANPDLKIESKIAFVSDRNNHKGVYCVYLSRPSEADIRIVQKNGEQIGNLPDRASFELTTANNEGDYPSFTGDGTAVVFEHFDGTNDTLLRYDFSTNTSQPIGLMKGSRRPAGMKNAIAQYSTEIINGNTVHLKWSRYTDTDVFYTVRFRVNQDGKADVEKRVFTQEETFLTGLDMGVEYLFRVSIEENGQEAAATQWQKVLIPEVAARPSYEIDKINPYLVHLKAWKPKDDTDWGFSWIIDNQEIAVQSSSDYLYEFSTSGTKTIVLKAHNKANTYTSVSDPMMVTIVSDIKPVVEYILADDRSYVELSAQKSLGLKIDWSSALWTVTGPGLSLPKTLSGSKGIIDISQFKNKINVNLRVSRFHVNGQSTTDNIEINQVLDLDYTGTKLVVIQESDKTNDRLVTFSGSNSIGNINWREARWVVFKDGQSLYQTNGISSFAYEFPETNKESRYSVSLSVPSMSDGKTFTSNNIVTIGAAPMVPEVDYEIVELKNNLDAVVGAKIIFSAANSKGNNIDFAQTKWTVPVAGTYGEQPTQMGPTAVYNLFTTGKEVNQVEVSLTLMRRGSSEALTVTKVINIKGNQVAKPELKVNPVYRVSGIGNVCELDVLGSTGPNIDWERTEWQFSSSINGVAQNSTQRGPSARIDIPSSAEDTVLRYTVTLYLLGAPQPLVKNGELRMDAKTLKPVINPVPVLGGAGNVYTFSVSDTCGVNIDWERTSWSFYDGNSVVTQMYGAQVTHSFVKKNNAMGYPVVVAMYFKNTAKPFYGYTSVSIDADTMVPVISWDRADATAGSEILFTAGQSTGSSIDWSQAKWSFGDGSPSQYGATVGHKYAVVDINTEYKVSLTLTRRLSNGETETATRSVTVTVGKDEVQPVVTAKLYRDGYLVLSAEESEGRGLLLDRCTWMFAGKGDNENTNISSQTGTSDGKSESKGWNVGTSVSTNTGGPGGLIPIFISAELSGGHSENTNTDHSDSSSLSSTDSFSNENYHTGMSARRWIGDYNIYAAQYTTQKLITVSLNVYRQDADGGMTGKVITVNINLADAVNGVSYR